MSPPPARDSWKKKYFETKKATAPLEEKLRGLQQQLETFYNKLLQQLQARDNRGRQRRNGRSSVKVTRVRTAFSDSANAKPHLGFGSKYVSDFRTNSSFRS